MSGRTVRRFVDGLLRGQRTERARPDDFEAQEMKTAIELRAARTGSDSPREEFVTDLHRRLAEQMGEAPQVDGRSWGPSGHTTAGRHRHRSRGGVGGHRDRGRPQPARSDPDRPRPTPPTQGVLEPNAGTWRAVGASADLPTRGALAFDLGSVSGFVHRADAQLEAVSGICTHQGCKLWLDAPESRLRCPCHSTSFSLEGKTLTHQLPDGSCAAAEVRGA